MSRFSLSVAVLLAGLCCAPVVRAGQIIEAETLTSVIDGGVRFAQNMKGFGSQWSNNHQLFWSPAKVGNRLELKFHVAAYGTYNLRVHVTRATDFGTVEIGMEGKKLSQYSGYKPGMDRIMVDLGNVHLKRGENTLIFVSTGKWNASSGMKVGIDSIELIPLVVPPQP